MSVEIWQTQIVKIHQVAIHVHAMKAIKKHQTKLVLPFPDTQQQLQLKPRL